MASSSFNRTLLCCSAALMFSCLDGAAQPPTPRDQIVSTARGHLTPAGIQWAAEEGRRLQRGEINPTQVEKDAAGVRGGILKGGVPDELVLVALINGQNRNSDLNENSAVGGARRVDTLQSKIQDLEQTLNDVQSQPRPAR